MYESTANRQWWLVAAIAAIFAAQALSLYVMGQVPICECGYVKLWHGVVASSENSQHISDWYTPSHVIHGFIFYWLARLVRPRWSLLARLALALCVEAAWEITENTDMVIDRYREATISLDYHGDSIINSVSDTAAALAGFLLAWRLPVAVTIAIGIFFELLTGYFIRDNLTLNVIMLLWPLDAIREWQGAAHAAAFAPWEWLRPVAAFLPLAPARPRAGRRRASPRSA